MHSNIHPRNILWHANLKTAYLSDFCYSRFLESPVGQKVKTDVVGNINFSSEDMIRVFDGLSNEA